MDCWWDKYDSPEEVRWTAPDCAPWRLWVVDRCCAAWLRIQVAIGMVKYYFREVLK